VVQPHPRRRHGRPDGVPRHRGRTGVPRPRQDRPTQRTGLTERSLVPDRPPIGTPPGPPSFSSIRQDASAPCRTGRRQLVDDLDDRSGTGHRRLVDDRARTGPVGHDADDQPARGATAGGARTGTGPGRLRRIMTAVAGRAGTGSVDVQRWPALGTSAVLCTDGGSASAARAAAEREIAAIDAAASRFRQDSELSRVNRAGGRWVPISERMLEALQLALRAAAVTDGAVDPTLGASLNAQGYDRDWEELARVGPGEPLDRGPHAPAARDHEAWRAVELGRRPPAVRVPAGLALDLGATAKALAADRGARAAHLAGGAGALLSLGGDVAVCGPPPSGGWLVRVTDDHRHTDDRAGQLITVVSGGLATSSLVARRWYHDGRAVHHVLDPRTGLPVHPVWRTVSVAAASCAEANIASTAALVLGSEATAWLAAHELPARLVTVAGAVETQSGWPL
jgi:thiamine biosynthesis lipoprotein